MMNQVFDFGRWWMLVTRHWGENRKRYGLAMLAMGGLLATWYGLLLAMDKFGPLNLFLQYATYYCGLYFVGCLYASTIFAELSNKAQGIGWLSVPASHLEKLLCGIFFGVVLFFIAYNIVYFIIDIPMVRMANDIIRREHQVWPGTGQPIGKVSVLNPVDNDWAPIPDRKYHLFLLAYFAFQSAFLLGSVYFKSYAFIKTIVALLLGWVVLLVFMAKIVDGRLPAEWHTYAFFEWSNYDINTGRLKLITLMPWLEKILLFLMQYSAPVVFWVVAYFRLKEKEV